MSTKNVLFTCNTETASPLWEHANSSNILHTPLEHFNHQVDNEVLREIDSHWDDLEFIILGNRLYAKHFLKWLDDSGRNSAAKEKVTLTPDLSASALAEKNGIPAVMPTEDARAIDVIEFLLRISRQGIVLYPCSNQQTDEIPGLLKELEMPVIEFQVCREVTVDAVRLESYRARVQSVSPCAVIFHNRSSVLRTKTAFPFLDFDSIKTIAADKGVAHRMKQEGITADVVCHGTWKSLAESV